MNKIKEKWSDPIFLEQISPVLEQFIQSNIEMSNLDLSGIELSCKSSVIQLRKAYLKQSKFETINMSYSFLSCSVVESSLYNIDFFRTKFDGCLMDKSIFKECNFRKSKLVINADDAILRIVALLMLNLVLQHMDMNMVAGGQNFIIVISLVLNLKCRV